MTELIITLSKNFIIDTDEDVENIRTNLSSYIDEDELINQILLSEDISEVFSVGVDYLDSSKVEDMLYCENCEEPITVTELIENNKLCDDCVEENNEEEFVEIP
jgi:formylmethanofuran dehydrogenase subunit E